jgi:hypothetical protein|tara:strand:- start:445 stop:666 length:222 start_codon:yes stop_codon:yes gene_type:complete
MNNATRKLIALKTDQQIDDDILRYEKSAVKKGSQMQSLRKSQQSQIQAHYDEKQARMMGTTAAYKYKMTVDEA